MICSSCRRSLLAGVRNLQTSTTTSSKLTIRTLPSFRTVSTAPSTPNAAASTPPPSTVPSSSTSNPTQSSSHPGTSQPLSTPHAPSSTPAEAKPKSIKPRNLKSSVPAGAELKGLGYTKAKPVIKALEDHEYPDWLWGLLEEGNQKPGEAKVDVSAMTKKQRARYDKAQEKILAKLPVQIPLHEQSKDLTLPGDDAITSLKRRQEVVKSKRTANRKGIREANFLKSM